MKIDKIVFSSSVEYSPFWNIQSRIWKTKFGIEPVCLLFGGTKKQCGLSEQYGTVHEIPFDPSLPNIIQLQFYKYYFPQADPEKVWMIGDIDQIPLQTEHFLEGLENVSENAYCHFNHALVAQIHNVPYEKCIVDGKPIFLQKGGNKTGGYDLPGHHHAAKGRIMKEVYFPEKNLHDTLKEIVDSGEWGMVKPWNGQMMHIHGNYWCADEQFSSDMLWKAYQKGGVFDSMFFKGCHIWNNKICRSGIMPIMHNGNQYWMRQWDGRQYNYDPARVKDKTYVEIHCHRGYKEQENSLMQLLEYAGMI